MNRFLDRLADLYTPLRLRGMLMDGQYRFAPDAEADSDAAAPSGPPAGARPARDISSRERPAPVAQPTRPCRTQRV